MQLCLISQQRKLIKPSISQWHPLQMRITWFGNQPEHVRVGDKWQLHIRLAKPHSYANPGSFNYQKWLFENRICAISTVQNSGNNLLLHVNRWYHPVDRFRQLLDEKLQWYLYGLPLAGMITALCVGMRDQISQQQWQVLRNTGTNHLMAIAGLHISCIASMTYFMVNFFWRRISRFTINFPVQQAAALVSLMSAIIYSALAGFALPTQRAVMMLAVFLLTTLLRRHISAWTAWSVALLIILIFDPLSTLSSSFWLSFGTVALIIYGNSARLKMQGIWWHWGRTQWVIGLGIVPLSLFFFNQVSLLSFIANSIAIPWVGFIILPLCFVGSLLLIVIPFIGKLLILIAEHLLNYLWIILEKLAAISILQWYASINHVWLMFSMIICIILFLAPRGWPARWLGMFWALPFIFIKIHTPLIGQIELTLIDAGKNEIAIIRTTHHTVLYEILAGVQKNNVMSQEIIQPYLLQQGIKKVDYAIIVTQKSNVLQGFNNFNNYPLLSCATNKSWQWDNIDWQVSSTDPRLCNLKLTTGNYNILFLSHLISDNLEELDQFKLVGSYKSIVVIPYEKNDVLNTARLFNSDKALIFILGNYNTRVSANHFADMNNYSTKNCGAIHFIIGENGLLNKIDCYKDNNKNFWE